MSVACSVVIPTYNAEETLGAQLAALASQVSDVAFEVIVADNGSTDASNAVAQDWFGVLDLRVVDASVRRGPSAARNIGVMSATAPLLLFCDADDVVGPDWVQSLVKALAHDPFVGGPYFPFSSKAKAWLPSYDTSMLPVAWDGCSYAFGGNFGVEHELWDKLGGFDESLTGAEEIEFAWRARELGCRPAFVSEASVAYRVRSNLSGRMWHEYNSGRGTTMLADRLVPHLVKRRSWKSQMRHELILAGRFPRSLQGAQWAAWAGALAYEAGCLAGRRRV
jgi:glycosyltransferase involved in cell wall biosynthesis